MLRYLRLYVSFMRFSLQKAMQFRFDFFFRIFMDTLFYATNLLGVYLLYQHTETLGGYDLKQIYLYFAFFFVVDGLFMVIFSSNMWWLPIQINKGELDYTLLRPVSPMFMLLTREFSANSLINLSMAAGMMIHALILNAGSWQWWQWTLLPLLLMNSLCIYVGCNLLFVLPVFWTQSGRGLNNLFFGLTRSIERPDRIYSPWLRGVLRTVLPLSLVVSVPVEMLFGDLHYLGGLVIVSLSLTLLIRIVWGLGLKQYQSASS